MLLDETTRRGGNRNAELDALVTAATRIESIHQLIEQAETDIATHLTPETYTVTWPV